MRSRWLDVRGREAPRGSRPADGSVKPPSQGVRSCVVCSCRGADPPTDLAGRTRTSSPCSPPWRCLSYRPSLRPRRASQSKLPPRAGRPRSSAPDGSTAADGRLIVETDNFIEAGTTPDPNPPLRVGFVGQCPDGTFSWGFVQAAPTQFDPDLKNVSVSGTFANVRDNRGGLHTVSVDAGWTGTGPIMTTVNGPGSKRKERSATATATIVFDGNDARQRRRQLPVPRAVHPRRYGEVARGPRPSSVPGRERQPKRASLGVLADGRCVARMDDAAAERLDLLQRGGQIVHREVGQGEGVAGPTTPRMEPNRRGR